MSGQPRLRVLGTFELVVDGAPVALPGQAERVLGYLAVVDAAPQREVLAGKLWTESSQTRANANLRNALWRVRQMNTRIVEATRGVVRLTDCVAVDLAESLRWAHELIDNGVATADRTLLPLLERDLLPSWDEEWIVLERERLRQLRLHALEALSRSLARQGRFADAIEAGFAAVSAEPLRESAHAVLIEAHLAEGNRSDAVRQLSAYRKLLDEELGLSPTPRLEALVAGVAGS